MSVLDQAVATQIANIETKTGERREALFKAVLAQGLSKHGEMVAWVKQAYGLGHGDANTLVHLARQSAAPPQPAGGDPLDEIYTGAKAHQRAIHDKLIAEIDRFGPYETAPKKGYVSLRRAKQFAMLGPKTKDRFEIGVNLKEDVDHPLARPVKPGGMCQHVISLTSADEIDSGLMDVLRRAYDAAG